MNDNTMPLADAVNLFGSKAALARAAKRSRAAVTQWAQRGYVPEGAMKNLRRFPRVQAYFNGG